MPFICHSLDCILGFLDILVDFFSHLHTLYSIELYGFWQIHKVQCWPTQYHIEQFNHPPPKFAMLPLCNQSVLPVLTSVNHKLVFLYFYLSWNVLYKWNYIISSLLFLASFTYQNALKFYQMYVWEGRRLWGHLETYRIMTWEAPCTHSSVKDPSLVKIKIKNNHLKFL